MSTKTEDMSQMSLFARGRLAFRYFRWRRPFWAGLLTVAAGLPIAWFPYRDVTLGDLTIRMATTAGAGSLIIGVLLVVLGLTMWFQPHARIFAGVAAILLSLVSLIVSNFGGFLVGFICGLLGGAMSVAWVPGEARESTPDGDAPGGNAAGGDRRAGDIEDREPQAAAAPGTGSALAGFQGAAPQPVTGSGKGSQRAE